MITVREVKRVASATQFRPDIVEKVLRLHGVLKRLTTHPMTAGSWALKGGTALNLLHLDVPRLSVDIDLNWVGSEDVEEMKRQRPDFERGMLACCEREGLSVRREPSEHAGGKFRLRYASVEGGTQNLEGGRELRRSRSALGSGDFAHAISPRHRPERTDSSARRARRWEVHGTGPAVRSPRRLGCSAPARSGT
jgi:hypothetical protein